VEYQSTTILPISLFVESIFCYNDLNRSLGPDEVAAWNMLGYIWEMFEPLTGKNRIRCKQKLESN
jgi:hypothetical protein